ncbi:N(2), N(2)-dimethylguanosine tRNA methyltransferase [Trypanosoma brucei gambiense DAL972]|uniref:tRNA (guanine(26)-N(2))-dimethyltransferase n=1 Tax=Trypanosoma brucei gambiense (strain MHOM/CI/86/DAL972) TaxID=679716 RepID=D0A6N2_TRYB9|nr:N(2), N(2)-dimethylguanosine tRNA methyltransferase [Trypanosoma brucei gambiense DAL972]CBH17333.1 N(2), N(2)-dimethylguanosine tRNA methyltransferase [Trypanosoma brucei gambiense DAL972]|eukprot:XP_011779597.1 N(2), N(2)-dimethylguanosine tRNA methyltransferase [Trypanosoma brucei gambiense DAL972]
MRSGLFGTEGLRKETPRGYTVVVEGTTAVLFPPAAGSSTQIGRGFSDIDKEEVGKQRKDDSCAPNCSLNSKEDNTCGEEDEECGQAVFYNPAQVVNRDLSVCVIACFSQLRKEEPKNKGGTRRGITILEALSATGLRAIRYYKEIPDVRFIIANDIDCDAVECIRRNCEFNEVPCVAPTFQENFPSSCIRVDETTGTVESGGAIFANLDDANDLMFRLATNPTVNPGHRLCLAATQNESCRDGVDTESGEARGIRPLIQQELVDVVDLDPYGSASPFLEGAMRCIREGGLLLVTSTDSAILCGNYPDTCHAKYNTVPTKNAACHEMAVRILLAAVERVANKHRKYIVPLLSLHIDFYVRCFVRVYTQPAEVKLSPCKLGYLIQCNHCPAFWVRQIAVSRMRVKKRPRKLGNAGEDVTAGSQGNVAKSEEHRLSDSGNARGTNEGGEAHKADEWGWERFPAAPSRRENPKIVSPSLQQIFPSSLRGHCCCVCGASVSLSGPIYAAPTQSAPFLGQLLVEIERRASANHITAVARISGLVRVAMEELADTPLFYQLPDVASFVRVRCPPAPLFIGALGRKGYRCSQVHCAPSGIKTDCPPEIVVGVMMRWKKYEEENNERVVEGGKEEDAVLDIHSDRVTSPPAMIEGGGCGSGDGKSNERGTRKKGRVDQRVPLVKPLSDVDFSYDKQFDFRGAVTGVAKFIPNAPNWGPKRKHQGAMHSAVDAP